MPTYPLLRSTILLATLLGSPSVCPAAPSRAFTGRVVGIHDGDTITVLDSTNRQHKVRLAAIEAPELHQAFGQRSR